MRLSYFHTGKNREYLVKTAIKILLLFLTGCAPLMGQEVTLAWNPNPESDLAGYNLYYGINEVTENIVNVGNVVKKVITVKPGTYRIAVSAYDQSGNESELSEVITHTVSQSAKTPEQPVIVSESFSNDTLSVTLRQDLKYTDGEKFSQSDIEQFELRLETESGMTTTWPLLAVWGNRGKLQQINSMAELGVSAGTYRWSIQSMVGGVRSRGSTPVDITFDLMPEFILIELKAEIK